MMVRSWSTSAERAGFLGVGIVDGGTPWLDIDVGV